MEIESARRQLQEDGFSVIPAAIDSGALRKLHDRVALFYQAWDRYPPSVRKELAPQASGKDYLPVREINWPEKALRLLDDEPAIVEIRRLVDALAGASCRLIHANSLLKPALNGAPIAPHQDTAYTAQVLDRPLTVWVPFEEATEFNGALYYAPGSHRLGELEHASSNGVRWLEESRLNARGNIDWKNYSGKPGSIGLHDSRLVHGSYANRSPRDRLALSLRFAAIL